ncbi:MAG: FliM/FliN family flagellar motor switch protein [Gammaproteobacteria bacterium]|uniref:FliM/FliN family flagellar motor switch protein n=1 Tax=Limnobacter sp. TaxID=2003368 RepID=UPI001D1B7E80|nr:FliM/FliN family flagellar motor switch protein [Limnobacter sp.]MBU0785075.1 FliM/FliN family flagellar motor switch protein [Gammaproteobacteria bacterium]MBU0849113.1 FliM/FliN family flagellar motor switch protein [Gammaproteobacteria bacterium]MBU1781450.1 FliM/FliN family flagellar motor switch protein [Gammaproteobacteria bacterium]MBU2086830.1 FliM/FliN family flagellar motor switch protein [Gammaproteobacteria bacterium]MBU2129807.1 FliM/FliN family flagellar motor switch protein [
MIVEEAVTNWVIEDLPELTDIPKEKSHIFGGSGHCRRVYKTILSELGQCLVIRNLGDTFVEPAAGKIYCELESFGGESVIAVISPELIWNKSMYHINQAQVDWSMENNAQIEDVVRYSILDVLEAFDLSMKGLVSSAKLSDLRLSEDNIVVNVHNQNVISLYASSKYLADLEIEVRQFSEQFARNKMWLGSCVSFKMKAYLHLTKKYFSVNDLNSLSHGDLLDLLQENKNDCFKLKASAVYQYLHGKRMRCRVSLIVDKKGIRMEFESGKSEEDEFQSEVDLDLAPTGNPIEQHNELVELEILAGTARVSFDDLCALGEGSLIEVEKSTLPMVSLRVHGTTVMEAELVRLGNRMMLQIVRKVEYDD